MSTRAIKLWSPLEPIALATRLKEEMEAREDRKDKHVHGGGTEQNMHLRFGKRNVNASWDPQFHAKMRAHRGGTLIEGEIGHQGSLKLFLIIWFGITVPFLLVGLGLGFADATDWTSNVIFTGLPAIMIAIGLGIWIYERRQPEDRRDGETEILEVLREKVRTQPHSER